MEELNIGDVLETAMWLDGRETEAQCKRFAKDVRAALDERAELANVVLSNPRVTTKRPGEPRVPEVPDHIQGPDVRLLVVEAEVLGKQEKPGAFLADLEPKDLKRLRLMTRAAYSRANPHLAPLTDRQCDTVINDLGPEAAVAALRRGQATIQ